MEEDAWNDFILAKNEYNKSRENLIGNTNEKNVNENYTHANDITKRGCTKCDSYDFHKEHTYIICRNCGLTMNDDIYYEEDIEHFIFEDEIKTRSSGGGNSNRLLKIQKWLQWSNEEKNDYKLKKYTRDLCEKLKVKECIIEPVCELVLQIMNAIKKQNDGPKRSRVKDGIIISCIYYTSKNLNFGHQYSYLELAKQINLDIKYISKADKIIMELVNCKQNKIDNNMQGNSLNINKDVINQMQQPIDYVINSINNYKLNIDDNIIQKTKILIEICEDNDILLDHTPLSIGASCFYYILTEESINIDTKLFSEMYNLSIVTIVKTYNKLLVYKDKINKFINEIK